MGADQNGGMLPSPGGDMGGDPNGGMPPAGEDPMGGMPEIGAALEILAEEATTMNKDGKILNVYSKSDRIKSVLEDLFYNRLDFNVWSTTKI